MKSSLNLTPTSPRTSSESRPSSEVPDLSLNLVHTHHLEPRSVTVPIVWSGEVHLTTRWFVPLVLVQSWSSPEFNCLNLQLQMNSLPLQRPILQCAANKQTNNKQQQQQQELPACWHESTRQAPEGLNNSACVSWTSPTLSCLVCSALKRVKYNKGWQISHAAQPIHCGTEVITTIKHERAFFNLIMGYYGYTVGTRHSQGWAASLHNQIILTGTAVFTKTLTQRNNTMPGLLS